MSLFNNLRLATYKGVPFKVRSAEDQLGRVTVVHKFPLRDQDYVEDLGRHGRAINLTGFVVGPAYQLQRDALIKALESPGPGTLIHPWLGQFLVSLAEPATVSHEAEQAGLVTFQMRFNEDAAPGAPAPKLNFPALAQGLAGVVGLLAGNALDLGFQAENVTAEALAAGQDWAGGLYELLAPVYPAGDFLPPVIDERPALFQEQIRQAGSFSALVDDFWPQVDYRRNAPAAKIAAEALLKIAAETEAKTVPQNFGSIRRRTALNERPASITSGKSAGPRPCGPWPG